MILLVTYAHASVYKFQTAIVFTSCRSNLPYKTLDGLGVHIATVKFSTEPAENLTSILGVQFFLTVSLVPFEQNPKTHEFSTGRKFVSIHYILTESEVITGKSQPKALMC